WGVLPIGALVLLLGATGWFGVSRLVRAEVRAAREREYVAAARALGASHARILLRHVLPAAWGPLLVASTLGIGHAIVAEAGLSFLGIGVAPPTASWGSIMRDGLDVLSSAWWVSFFPGLALVVTVLAVNVVADGLREVANPRQLPPP
ncbi:MAG TPA: ABC transporter permease, partial [Gemmatimonadales bacterium]|nr:ABC transporter permease [Gemmatimonadales bacterium]